jgi:hypothetical protein
MTNPRDDLKATEQSIQRDAKKIAELEEQKANLDPADPVVERISAQVQETAQALTDKSVAEQGLVDEIQASGKRSKAH